MPTDGSAQRREEANRGRAKLSIGPSLAALLANVPRTRNTPLADRRVILISLVSCVLAALAAGVALLLTRLIGLITNLAFYGRVSTAFSSPADNRLGALVMVVPVVGGLLVGVLARYGSRAIRGHGIPEAMEQVLTNKSRIPARLTWLKPLSAAIAIGTGGPFGAEGPIIASGGALGSLLGQLIHTSAMERKTLLAAGAAAGMAATFGSPVSAVLLAVELLLFEYRPRSLIPVALAASIATVLRGAAVGMAPVFPTPQLTAASPGALLGYIALGTLCGVCSIGVTRATYAVEDAFEKLPLHFMWWPAIGAIAVGVIGYFNPHTLGVGYDNIEHIVAGALPYGALASLCALKFLSWVISLGSGTSGGTLAPLFTVGGGLGGLFGLAVVHAFPGSAIDVHTAALVGMAALFAGASRAPLASAVFAFETTQQPAGLLPILAGCTCSYLISCLYMRNTIMTEKIVRRGVRVLGEYSADELASVGVRELGVRPVVSLRAEQTLGEVLAWLASGAPGTGHQGFPVLERERVIGVLTRRDLAAQLPPSTQLAGLVRRDPVCVSIDSSLREAANLMAREHIGRLPVLGPDRALVGILSRSDLIAAYGQRLAEHELEAPLLRRRRHRREVAAAASG